MRKIEKKIQPPTFSEGVTWMPSGDSSDPKSYNEFLVGAVGDSLVITAWTKLSRPLTRAQALNLAAWLVLLGDDPVEPKFGKLLRRARET